jgi:hypothetical protein
VENRKPWLNFADGLKKQMWLRGGCGGKKGHWAKIELLNKASNTVFQKINFHKSGNPSLENFPFII